ncbi:IS3 family transposase [Microbacterium sp. 2C]|uniref:IS3 family transposase n=1 Tax=Microbacterium paulum TaxID=2707006 RepID=UPI0018C2D959|nr:IS3 family transposase [Microbacterium paulum]
MGFRLVQELAADGVPVAVACRFLGVSTSGYHERRERMPSPRSVADAELTITIRRIHSDSREIYGAPRVLAELRPGLGVQVGRKRVARLMRLDGLVGVSHRRKRRGWKPDTATHEDLVKRQFRADAPYRLWFCDITQHRARDGWVYCAAVIDAYSRRIVGWSISDRITAEIVVDALEMARWRRRVRLRGSGVRVPSGQPWSGCSNPRHQRALRPLPHAAWPHRSALRHGAMDRAACRTAHLGWLGLPRVLLIVGVWGDQAASASL